VSLLCSIFITAKHSCNGSTPAIVAATQADILAAEVIECGFTPCPEQVAAMGMVGGSIMDQIK
jgi:hypothetical protein